MTETKQKRKSCKYTDEFKQQLLGGYRKDRREGKEGLTFAGLMMFKVLGDREKD